MYKPFGRIQPKGLQTNVFGFPTWGKKSITYLSSNGKLLTYKQYMPSSLILHCSPNVFQYVPKLSTQKGFFSQMLNYEKKQCKRNQTKKYHCWPWKKPRNLPKGNNQINMPNCTRKIFLSRLTYNKKLENIQKPNNRLLNKYGVVL